MACIGPCIEWEHHYLIFSYQTVKQPKSIMFVRSCALTEYYTEQSVAEDGFNSGNFLFLAWQAAQLLPQGIKDSTLGCLSEADTVHQIMGPGQRLISLCVDFSPMVICNSLNSDTDPDCRFFPLPPNYRVLPPHFSTERPGLYLGYCRRMHCLRFTPSSLSLASFLGICSP